MHTNQQTIKKNYLNQIKEIFLASRVDNSRSFYLFFFCFPRSSKSFLFTTGYVWAYRLANAKMKKGVSVKERVLNMINLMHEEEIHGATIDECTQVSIILKSLTPAFSQFTTNYVMNKLQYNMTQLLNELQTFKAISKTRPKEGEANVAEHKPSSFSSSKNKKRKNTQCGSGAQPKKGTKGKGKKNNPKDKKPKGKCFHCGVEGHWKRNCNKYLSELKDKKKGKYDLLVSEACLVEDDLSPWIIDSGATNHVCSSLQILSS